MMRMKHLVSMVTEYPPCFCLPLSALNVQAIVLLISAAPDQWVTSVLDTGALCILPSGAGSSYRSTDTVFSWCLRNSCLAWLVRAKPLCRLFMLSCPSEDGYIYIFFFFYSAKFSSDLRQKTAWKSNEWESQQNTRSRICRCHNQRSFIYFAEVSGH